MTNEKATLSNPAYRPDSGFCSIVSYPRRCELWGDSRFRGNCDGRLFLNLLHRYQPQSVADPMMGSGTTRDVVEGLNQHTMRRIQYWGSDLRTGFNLLDENLPGRYDFVWVHPPYWNIIRYSQDPSDLSNFERYDEFLTALRVCLRRCASSLVRGGRLAVLVGDVRRGGTYTPIVRDVLNLDGQIGQLRSVIIKAQHNCRSDSVSYSQMEDPRIQHEYCVLFKKT